MKIVIISGSPHRNGTSSHLVSEFVRGAEEKGHEVVRFDAAFADIHPCIACERCRRTDKGCVFQDDMQKLNPSLQEADCVVFATPIYYYGIGAQLKTVIDRFYANNESLQHNKKAVLLTTMADTEDDSVESLLVWYRHMVSFMDWTDVGRIIGKGCMTVDSLKETNYPALAYELGKQL